MPGAAQAAFQSPIQGAGGLCGLVAKDVASEESGVAGPTVPYSPL